MTRTLSLTTIQCLLLVVPAAHAAEPSATPKNAAQWCKAWKAGTQIEKLNAIWPTLGMLSGLVAGLLLGHWFFR